MSPLAANHRAVAHQVAGLVARSLAAKSVEGYVRDFITSLSGYVASVFNGNMTAGTLADKLRTLIRTEARPTYLEGLSDAGSKDPEADMESADEQIVDGWIADQLDFISGFAEDVAAARRADDPVAAQQAINTRVETWGASLATLGAKGKASYLSNRPGTWQYGDTDHCDTCQKLNGERHRLKWFMDKGYIPQQPGSETLDCHGYRCQCIIVDDEGDQLLP